MNPHNWNWTREVFDALKDQMPVADPADWNIAGLALALPGILLLFAFGMPFHVPRKGDQYLKLHGRSTVGPALERMFTLLSFIGLSLIIAGTSLQMWASILEIVGRK